MVYGNGMHSRRRFLRSAAAAPAAPLIVPGSVLGLNGATPPSDRITLGGIGIGRRGQTVLNDFLEQPDVQFVAVCDVRNERREEIKSLADKKYGNRDCAAYSDMFELLARPDIDAVLIATSDRWHALISIYAAKAGKDIYCEKPCSMTIAESRALADTVRRYGRIFQAGTQRRNISNFVLAVEMARSGKLGKLTTVHANTLDPRTTHDWLPPEPEPPKQLVDWDRWLGPAPWRPYNAAYIAGRWRGFWDLHGGGILEWGAHTVDLCQWANNADETTPVEYTPQGNHILCRYANGVQLVMRDTGWMGLGTCSVRFEGDAGWVETGDTGKMEASENLRSEIQLTTMPGTRALNHVRDFLDCVRSRRQPRSHEEATARAHIACHAAYIAWQLGRTLRWDPAREEFLNDDQANRMRSRAMREPWRI